MPQRFLRTCLIATVLVTVAICTPDGNAQSTIGSVVAKANTFIATLTDAQRAKVLYDFSDQAQRARWSNFPTGFVPRGGINLKSMTPPQRDAALALMQAVLSPAGYTKVSEIRAADDDFKTNGSKRGPRNGGGPPAGAPPGGGPPNGAAGPPPDGAAGSPPNGPRGGPPSFNADDMFGSGLYYISFLGKPSTTAPWMLQFGGHHLALNITIIGSKGIMTPSLTGAQPATFKVGNDVVRPLAHESDDALLLLQSLTPAQRAKAVLPYKVADLVLGPGQDGKRIAPEGLQASAMSAAQNDRLLLLIAQWAGILNDAMAAPRIAQLRAELDQTYFAWSGPTDGKVGENITAYYRIQGPHLVIEYAPQSDEPNNHVHTIYRDPTDDYGVSSTAK